MRFYVTIDRDEDGVWVVECPSIPGCVSQARPKKKALTNIQEAIQLCLEVRAERGLPLTVETRQVRYWSDARPPPTERREVVRVFERLGWEMARQKGSHIVMVREGHLGYIVGPRS